VSLQSREVRPKVQCVRKLFSLFHLLRCQHATYCLQLGRPLCGHGIEILFCSFSRLKAYGAVMIVAGYVAKSGEFPAQDVTRSTSESWSPSAAAPSLFIPPRPRLSAPPLAPSLCNPSSTDSTNSNMKLSFLPTTFPPSRFGSCTYIDARGGASFAPGRAWWRVPALPR
jgi:hypothetical protein